ncbi:MAG: 2Fe-2S iron-sulfur cluster binding domain-containing protein, partial [Spirochaetes bacterium]|nr:2Fe-2S iron-sulfur cluster binding domain-containing protein [Spirochaetota bacterium]
MEGIFKINGKEIKVSFKSDAVLLSLLRENGCTEVKEGCREGECGS